MITAKQLKSILYKATDADIEKYIKGLNTFLDKYDINTPHRKAAFIAQIGHESCHLKDVEENLNYSAEGLRKTFGKYFQSEDIAKQYARQPEKIANIVYANRMGNGTEDSGDGWKYRGRGLLQITGKTNYQYMSQCIGIDFVTSPDKLLLPEYAVQTACFWWKNKGLNELADLSTEDSFKQITRIINGGVNGLNERSELWKQAKDSLFHNIIA